MWICSEILRLVSWPDLPLKFCPKAIGKALYSP
jgi:hypothetical protein